MASQHSQSDEQFASRVVRKARRLAKQGWRIVGNRVSGHRPQTRVVFILGAQRSGTRVPLVALERAPGILTYREGASPFFQGNTLRPDDDLEALFDRCEFPVLVIKPLSESHRALELLARFPTSRVVWIFRRPEDTARSASIKWKSGADVVQRLVEGTLPPTDWRRGGVSDETFAVARAMYRPGLGLEHANLILWYLRTRLLIDLDLFSCERALVVRFEDLTAAPLEHFPRVFDFIGQKLDPTYLKEIRAHPSRPAPMKDVPPEVLAICRSLYTDVEQRYLAVRERVPSESRQ